MVAGVWTGVRFSNLKNFGSGSQLKIFETGIESESENVTSATFATHHSQVEYNNLRGRSCASEKAFRIYPSIVITYEIWALVWSLTASINAQQLDLQELPLKGLRECSNDFRELPKTVSSIERRRSLYVLYPVFTLVSSLRRSCFAACCEMMQWTQLFYKILLIDRLFGKRNFDDCRRRRSLLCFIKFTCDWSRTYFGPRRLSFARRRTTFAAAASSCLPRALVLRWSSWNVCRLAKQRRFPFPDIPPWAWPARQRSDNRRRCWNTTTRARMARSKGAASSPASGASSRRFGSELTAS